MNYDPEKVYIYEIGVKADFTDGKLRFNPTIFQADYGNNQDELLRAADTKRQVSAARHTACTLSRRDGRIAKSAKDSVFRYRCFDSSHLHAGYPKPIAAARVFAIFR